MFGIVVITFANPLGVVPAIDTHVKQAAGLEDASDLLEDRRKLCLRRAEES
jgi:hypothetical protein